MAYISLVLVGLISITFIPGKFISLVSAILIPFNVKLNYLNP